MTNSPINMNCNPQSIFRYLTDHGFMYKNIYEAADLPSTQEIEKVTSLPLESTINLINSSAIFLDDDSLGLKLSRVFSIDDWGPENMGKLLFSYAGNIRDLLSLAGQLYPLISPGLQLRLEEKEQSSRISINLILPVSIDARHFYELIITWTINLFKNYIGQDWTASQVDFTHPKPNNLELHKSLLGNNVRFSQPTTGFEMETRHLDTIISDVDPSLLKEKREKLNELLKEANKEGSILSKVRYFVMLTIKQHDCHADQIAKMMCISERSLSRRLNEQGTNFRKVKEDVTIEIAKTALAYTHSSISDIAMGLGLSEVSVLNRAFKKATGLTPKQYRSGANDH